MSGVSRAVFVVALLCAAALVASTNAATVRSGAVVFACGEAVCRLGSDGRSVRLAAGASGVVSPDGKRLAYVRGGSLFVRELPSGPTTTSEALNRPLLLRFDRRARTVGVVEIGGLGSTQVCLYAAALPPPDANRRCIATGVSSGFDFLPSGRVIMSTRSSANSGRTRLCLLAPPGAPRSGCQRDVVADPRFDLESPAVSPDGRRVAVVRANASTRGAIAVYDLRTGRFVTQVTRGPTDGVPAWSPDGKQIVFDRGRAGGRGLWLVDARGATGNEKRLARRGEMPSWGR